MNLTLPAMTMTSTPVPTVPQTDAEYSALAAELESRDAPARLRWGLETFGERLVLSTSFGIQSAVMLHLAQSVAPGLPVIFVDTGYLFPETYQFAESITARLGLNLHTYSAQRTAARQEALEGKRWERGLKDLEAYNYENKVEPMNRALAEFGAQGWVAGLRRNQSSTRANLRVIEPQDGILKLYPILDWSDRDIYEYLKANDLPYHPLWEEGYVSVGDLHSSVPLMAGMTPEQTRFGGLKRECGLHESRQSVDFSI